MSLCFAAWGFFYTVLHRGGIDYIRYYLWTSSYFFLVGSTLCFLFLPYITQALQDFTPTPFALLGIFALAQLGWCLYFPFYVKKPTAYFKKYPDRYYLEIDWRRLVSKSMDIFAQQVFIVLLVMFLKDAGLPFYQILIAFGVLFALLHAPLIASERGAWPSWLFAGIVVVFSVIFPTLVLYVPYGFVYNYILHWLFYIAVASVFWITHNRPQGAVVLADL
jgi:hypothetical protein